MHLLLANPGCAGAGKVVVTEDQGGEWVKLGMVWEQEGDFIGGSSTHQDPIPNPGPFRMLSCILLSSTIAKIRVNS